MNFFYCQLYVVKGGEIYTLFMIFSYRKVSVLLPSPMGSITRSLILHRAVYLYLSFSDCYDKPRHFRLLLAESNSNPSNKKLLEFEQK